jgi:hypothetical protein
VIISLVISSLAKPRLIMFCKKGKKANDAEREFVSGSCLKRPKHTSYGKMGK